MRKFLLLLLVLCAGQMSFATDMCPNAYDLTSGWSRFASRVSGSNFIHKTMLEHYLEKQISQYAQGKFNIKIDSFSATDLKDGKFKSLNATGENVVFDGLSASKVQLSSLCDFNQLQKTENSKYRFVSDFPAEITLELSADDLNNFANAPEYRQLIRQINQKLLGFLRVENIKFDISDNKLWYNLTVSTPFSPKKQTVRIGTELNLINDNIKVNSSESSSKPTILSILNMTDTLNYVNPLDFSAKILENSIMNADINQISIANDKIVLKAFINIRK